MTQHCIKRNRFGKANDVERKTEFHQNVICRLVVPEKYEDSDGWIKRELDDRNTLKCKMRNFIQVMSHVTNCFVKKKQKDPSPENNSLNTFRYPTYQQRMEAAGKRKRQAETSTPASDHRMVTLIQMDESPIGGTPPCSMSGSGLESGSGDSARSDGLVVEDGASRAGLSNEIDATNLTPPKELSSGTIGYNLAIGADNLTDAGLLSNTIEEFESEKINTGRTSQYLAAISKE